MGEVHRQLDRILADFRFPKSPSPSKFLKFAVEQTLAGQGNGLKESMLGSAVFDLKEVLFRVGPARPETIYAASAGSTPAARKCEQCGRLEDCSADGKWLLYDSPANTSLMLMDWKLGISTEWLRYAPQNLTHAVFSPNCKRVAVAIAGSSGFVIPLDAHLPPSRNEWVHAVQDPDPQFLGRSRDSANIYYFSRRDGHNCFWRRPASAEAARASSDPVPIVDFHSNERAPWSGWLSVAAGRISFVITESRANIWMASGPSGGSIWRGNLPKTAALNGRFTPSNAPAGFRVELGRAVCQRFIA
ncbi:MAG: hypothetical protein ACLQBJ_10590 [Bryobacteraceae bacterium]